MDDEIAAWGMMAWGDPALAMSGGNALFSMGAVALCLLDSRPTDIQSLRNDDLKECAGQALRLRSALLARSLVRFFVCVTGFKWTAAAGHWASGTFDMLVALGGLIMT